MWKPEALGIVAGKGDGCRGFETHMLAPQEVKET